VHGTGRSRGCSSAKASRTIRGGQLGQFAGQRDDEVGGDAQLLVTRPIYVQLAWARDGALYGVSSDGSLDRLADGRATPVVRLPAGHKVVAVAAADALAFVVASDATPPVHAVVVGSPAA